MRHTSKKKIQPRNRSIPVDRTLSSHPPQMGSFFMQIFVAPANLKMRALKIEMEMVSSEQQLDFEVWGVRKKQAQRVLNQKRQRRKEGTEKRI